MARKNAFPRRQQQVLVLLAEGLTYDEIAECMGIAPNTVLRHVQKTLRRLGARNSRHAVAIALRTGILV